MNAGITVETGGEEYDVRVSPAQGDSRSFSVPRIPLTGTVRRIGPTAGEIHYSTEPPVDIDAQELYTPGEFDRVLDDDEMPSHAAFVIGAFMRHPELEK